MFPRPNAGHSAADVLGHPDGDELADVAAHYLRTPRPRVLEPLVLLGPYSPSRRVIRNDDRLRDSRGEQQHRCAGWSGGQPDLAPAWS